MSQRTPLLVVEIVITPSPVTIGNRSLVFLELASLRTAFCLMSNNPVSKNHVHIQVKERKEVTSSGTCFCYSQLESKAFPEPFSRFLVTVHQTNYIMRPPPAAREIERVKIKAVFKKISMMKAARSKESQNACYGSPLSVCMPQVIAGYRMGTQELCACKSSNHYALLCYSDNGYSLVSKRDMALPSQSHEISHTKQHFKNPPSAKS